MARSLDARKWAAKRRAELALANALFRIDYYENVIKPEQDAIDAGEVKLVQSGDYLEDAKSALGGTLELEQ